MKKLMGKNNSKLNLIQIVIVFFILIMPSLAFAQARMIVIRDTEIEDFLYEISRPIFKTAGLNPDQIRFYIIQDNSINAFVSGGQNIFVNTGTITHFSEPDALLGIIAHETGHIAGGHLIKIREEAQNQQKVVLGAVVIGMLAGLAGSPEAMQASMLGGSHIGQQNILQYSRTQENSADRLAINYLLKNHMSPEALLKSMEEFKRDELNVDSSMEYYITHPLSASRVQHVKASLRPDYSNYWFNRKYEKKFNLVKAKIIGYTESEETVLRKYPKSNNFKNAQYARAISYSLNNRKKGLRIMNDLIREENKNPYFYEARGSILLNFGEVKKAIEDYREANSLLVGKPLIQIALASAIIKAGRSDLYKEAIFNLEKASTLEKDNLQARKLLAEVYYETDQMDLSYLNLAEYYSLIKDREKTFKYLQLAEENTKDPKVLLKIEDLRATSR